MKAALTGRIYQDDLERALAASRTAPLDLSRASALDLNAAALLLAHIAGGGEWVAPASPDARSWLRRIGFDGALGGPPPDNSPSDVMLEFSRIDRDEDVGRILARVSSHASELLRRDLNYSQTDVARFTVALSEIAHNIPEHAGSPGWAALHRYRFRGRTIVKIAVVDAGIGVHRSLGAKTGAGTDLEALEAAFLRNISRHDDPGRGHGLREVRGLAERWGAKITLRSGTAKLGYVPQGMHGYARATGLGLVKGTQVLMSFPEKR